MSKNAKDTTVYVAYEDFAGFDPSRPEKNLLRAILMNAMSDLRKPGELSRKAREYFLSVEEDYIFSFNSVCNFLDIDPKRVLLVTGLRQEAEARRRQRRVLEAMNREQVDA